MDGFNPYRESHVLEIIEDFKNYQYRIADTPSYPEDMNDYQTAGWAELRQCNMDGQHILECGADTSVPQVQGGQEEHEKTVLQRNLLDAYARRHEAQKICLRQDAALRWLEMREAILQGQRPRSSHEAQLRACDQQLRRELQAVTDQFVYDMLRNYDYESGRWMDEDPSLRAIQRWVRSRRQT